VTQRSAKIAVELRASGQSVCNFEKQSRDSRLQSQSASRFGVVPLISGVPRTQAVLRSEQADIWVGQSMAKVMAMSGSKRKDMVGVSLVFFFLTKKKKKKKKKGGEYKCVYSEQSLCATEIQTAEATSCRSCFAHERWSRCVCARNGSRSNININSNDTACNDRTIQ
jgi:hypothetical protein